jgi:hypothetical protein
MSFVVTQQKFLESGSWILSVRAGHHTVIEAFYAIAAG